MRSSCGADPLDKYSNIDLHELDDHHWLRVSEAAKKAMQDLDQDERL